MTLLLNSLLYFNMQKDLIFINEFEIDSKTSKQINQLLQSCFSFVDYNGFDYFKQMPHYRILVKENGKVIGHLGIDFRAMNLNGEAIHVFGVKALCVDSHYQGQGIGKLLLAEFEAIATRNSHKIDFLFLVTESPKYYEALGYQQVNVTTTWLKIDQHINYGLGTEKIEDVAFMVKQISDKKWMNGNLDLLGYMY